MNKEKLDFKGSCEFYCKYHKVGNLEMTMICGNLGIVVDRLLKSQRKEIVEKIEIGIDEIFSKRKEVCTCPKGGMYGDEVCSDCGGTEWALSKELKEIGQEIINLINKEDE